MRNDERSGRKLILVAMLFACGRPDAPSAPEPTAATSGSEVAAEDRHDPESVAPGRRHERDERQRIEEGETRVAVFRGRFVSSGLPAAPTKAIWLGDLDANFILEVAVLEVIGGALPEGWTSRARFAIHSPSLFFGVRGLAVAEDSGLPEGELMFDLWRRPDGSHDLMVDPMAAGDEARQGLAKGESEVD